MAGLIPKWGNGFREALGVGFGVWMVCCASTFYAQARARKSGGSGLILRLDGPGCLVGFLRLTDQVKVSDW
jgi:hypothetical protein